MLNAFDIRSLMVCKRVCRTVRGIIDGSALLQYKIELAMAGMEDVPSYAMMSTSERLARLRQYRHSWDHLAWNKESTIDVQKGAIWELSGGVFAQSVEPQEAKTLVFTRLASYCRGVEEETWMIGDLGFIICDISIDPSQDLLVAIEAFEQLTPPGVYPPCRIHIRSLSTGKPHPRASSGAVLCCEVRSNWTLNGSFDIQHLGNYLGVLWNPPQTDLETTLYIWNWKTGSCVTIPSDVGQLQSAIFSFAFVDEEHVLVAQAQEDSWLRIYDLRACPPTSIILGFPEIVNDSRLVHIRILSDPAPSQVGSSSRVPFINAWEYQLFLVGFDYRPNDSRDGFFVNEHLEMYLPLMTLLDVMDFCSNSSGLCDRIPWEQWGPSGTRFWESETSLESVWVCYMHGMKCVSPNFAVLGQVGRCQAVQLLDFHPFTRARRPEGQSRYVDEEVVIPHGLFFRNDVRTTLPYRITFSDRPLRVEDGFVAVMMTGDGLLTVDGVWPWARQKYGYYAI